MERSLIRIGSGDFQPIDLETVPQGASIAVRVKELTSAYQYYGSLSGSILGSAFVCLVGIVWSALSSVTISASWYLGVAGFIGLLSLAGRRWFRRAFAAKKALDALIDEDRVALAACTEQIRAGVEEWNAALGHLRETVASAGAEHAGLEGTRQLVQLAEHMTENRRKLVARIEELQRRAEQTRKAQTTT